MTDHKPTEKHDPLMKIIEAGYHCAWHMHEYHAAIAEQGLDEVSDESIHNLLGKFSERMAADELRYRVNEHYMRFKHVYHHKNHGRWTLEQLARDTWPVGKVQGIVTCMQMGFCLDRAIEVVSCIHDQYTREYTDWCKQDRERADATFGPL